MLHNVQLVMNEIGATQLSKWDYISKILMKCITLEIVAAIATWT